MASSRLFLNFFLPDVASSAPLGPQDRYGPPPKFPLASPLHALTLHLPDGAGGTGRGSARPRVTGIPPQPARAGPHFHCATGRPSDSLSKRKDKVLDGEDKEQRRSSREAFLKITLHFLRRMKQEELADRLQSRGLAEGGKRKLKSKLQKKFQSVFEGIAKTGNPTLLNQMFTEIYITKGGTAEVNDEHEVIQIETASRKPDTPEITIRQEDMFKALPGRDEPIRTVMTKEVAGIAKTVLTQKFTLDWAEDKANQHIQFTFPFTGGDPTVPQFKKFLHR
ncbi:uncharacterized protein LOC120575316 [Perca fluviatilis]|uniref:uncharacterized protein LOC120575316 n=1 Tax=Perca fluviatilis TaxID=8168 RepID=UPI0019636AD5|nr:uncharacterized protein LOC120575316 [Perca fluviatilis]